MNESLGLKDKVVLVTGGTRGIGAEIVSVLRNRGDKVFTISRGEGKTSDHISMDLSSKEQISSLAKGIGRRKIDNLIFCHYSMDELHLDPKTEDIKVSFPLTCIFAMQLKGSFQL